MGKCVNDGLHFWGNHPPLNVIFSKSIFYIVHVHCTHCCGNKTVSHFNAPHIKRIQIILLQSEV